MAGDAHIDWQTEDYVKGVIAHIEKMKGIGEDDLRATAVVIVNTGKSLAPRKTSYMANNIAWEEGRTGDGQFQILITCRAHYWKFVEFGHRIVAWGHQTAKFQPARPFMRPAFIAGLQFLKGLAERQSRR